MEYLRQCDYAVCIRSGTVPPFLKDNESRPRALLREARSRARTLTSCVFSEHSVYSRSAFDTSLESCVRSWTASEVSQIVPSDYYTSAVTALAKKLLEAPGLLASAYKVPEGVLDVEVSSTPDRASCQSDYRHYVTD